MTCRKCTKNLLPRDRFIWSPLLCESKEDPKVFLLCPNRNDSQSFKSSSCKILCLLCVCYRCNLIRLFFIPRNKWKTLFLISLSLLWVFCWDMLFSSKQVFWKKSVFYVISTITLQSYYQGSKKRYRILHLINLRNLLT